MTKEEYLSKLQKLEEQYNVACENIKKEFAESVLGRKLPIGSKVAIFSIENGKEINKGMLESLTVYNNGNILYSIKPLTKSGTPHQTQTKKYSIEKFALKEIVTFYKNI